MEDNRERLKRLKAKANRLPLTPGVYIMKNAAGEIIYIGKAKALKNRVTQYFTLQGQENIKVQKMVDNVQEFDYILTDSEFEALVLECSLIKRHHPKYNILLKDDKGYHYIKVTGEEWKRLSYVFRQEEDGSRYYGPYTGGFLVSQSVDDAKRIFKLPTCGKVFPCDIGRGRPCLRFYISQCSAPCAGHIKKEEYNDAVDDAVDFLMGGDAVHVKEITAAMEKCAEELDFERAAVLRDRLSAIQKVKERQKVISATHKEQDIFALASGDQKTCFAVLRFIKGQLADSVHYIFDELSEPEAGRASFLTAFYDSHDRIPPRIALDGEVEGKENLERYLSEKRGAKVQITLPQKGEQVQLLEMCRQNALQKLTEYMTSRSGRELQGLLELQALLKLPVLPRVIEAYDISHTGGEDAVGGMVVYRDGKPLKSAYRRFTIKSFEGQDDCRALAEVVSRRLNEHKKSEDKSSGFGLLPDVILLDGGRAQVHAVSTVLEAFDIDIPLFGMVKDSRHRTAAIASSGARVEFNVKRKAFTLVYNIQEETHRYAIAYHHKKHTNNTMSLMLCEIDGVGKTRAAALLKHFSSLEAIRKASVAELNSVKGINITVAEAIYKSFHTDS